MGEAMGVVFMALKEREVSGVCFEGQFPRQCHAYEHQVQAPDGVVLTGLV